MSDQVLTAAVLVAHFTAVYAAVHFCLRARKYKRLYHEAMRKWKADHEAIGDLLREAFPDAMAEREQEGCCDEGT